MTKSRDSTNLGEDDTSVITKKSDIGQHFLRAARAGNIQKVLLLINEHNADVHACNANGLNALHLASKEGHAEVVRELIERGAKPNTATKKGNTALHIASLAGQFEVVKLLLEAGAEVNIQAQNGFTPLYMAAQENHLEVVRLLLSNGANPGLTTDDGFTPLAVALQQGHDRVVALLLESDSRGKICLPALHIASKKDDIKAANLLLNSDVNVDHQSASGFTPLHIAAHYGNVNMTELLISRGANINFQAKNNITPLHAASKWGNQGVAERLITAGAELDCRTRDGLTPLHCAARSGHDTVVQLLLSAGANISAKTRSGLNSLHMAAQGDHVDTARLLLQHGAQIDDPTIDYLTALHVAAHCGNVRVAKLLLERGCDVNARALNGFTPLHIACQKNRIKIVELLLKYNCLIQATTESGLTPLHVACFMGHLNIVVLLLQHGANANAPTVRCETSLHLATRAGQTDVARLLLRNGAQVDVKARGNQTPLHIASRIGNLELVTLLLEHAANVQCSTKDTYTPLHLAAKGNHKEICEMLLKNGADLEITTKSGFTPLHLAVKHSHLETAKYLLLSGADMNAVGRNGLTPLHLATHYGCLPMVQLLLEHKASPVSQAKNGFIPLHIAAEKHLVDIGKLLIEATVDSNNKNKKNTNANGGYGVDGGCCSIQSRNGFTPLHLACQDGNEKMTKLLIDSGSKVNALAKNGLTAMHLAAQEDSVKAAELLFNAGSELDLKTKAGYTPLHTACHFGQVNMVRFLLGKGADVNAITCMGSNALHLAAQQGHSTVIYILLESGANPNMRNKYGWTPAHVARHQHYLNIFEALRQVTTCVESWEHENTDELPMNAELASSISSGPEYHNSSLSRQQHISANRLGLEHPDMMRDNPITDTEEECIGLSENRISRDYAELAMAGAPSLTGFSGLVEWDFTPDNVPIPRKPIASGFLVSFLVDARGGSMRGSRHPGLRILVPPSAASAPTRITCRMLRPERTARPPQLNDCEGLACRRIRQESSLVGSDGGVLSSTVVPQVQAVFPEGALQKRIRVGLQAQPIAPELVTRLFGNRVTVSPIVTLEPRRRKFHKPITLTIPLPKAVVRGMLNPSVNDLKSQNVPSLRLLCSITGGTAPAQWEDITGSTPLSKVKDCVSFTTTVSARFWLMDCSAVHEAAEYASMLYAEATLVPYMGKFVVFTKRLDMDEALVRCFCVTDDKVDKTLECQEGFELCAASPEVEIIESRPVWLETAGNLLPVAKLSEQLRLHFNAFHENRLAFPVRVKDLQQEVIGKLAFMREPRQPIRDGDGDSQYIYHEIAPIQKPLCTLEIRLSSDNGVNGQHGHDLSLIGLENHPEFLDQLNETSAAELTMGSLSCVFPYPKRIINDEQIVNGQNNEVNKPSGNLASTYTSDVIARSQIDLLQVASEIGSDWPKLIEFLLPQSHLNSSCTVNQLVNWINESEPKWQIERNRLAMEMGKITGENDGGDVAGSFGGPISVNELRTIQDQALAVLLAWREENGDSATGNELDYALRRIGREDVIKSCMRDIRYVLDADEHAKATRQIDEGKRSDPVNPNLSDPFSTSLAATTTLMSGMNDITADSADDVVNQSMIGFDRTDALKHPDVRITPMHDESEPILQSHLGLDSQSPRKSDVIIHGISDEEEGRPSPALQPGQTELEEDNEEFWQQQQQAGVEPACSTSQQGGDPMVIQKHDEIIVHEEADIIRDSESMSSSELILSAMQGSQQEICDADAKIADTLKLEDEVEDVLQSQQQLESTADYHKEADLLSPTQIHQEQHSTTSLSEDNNGNIGLKQLTSANNTITNDITPSTRSQPTSEHCWDQEDDLSDIVLQNETDKMAETDIHSSHDDQSSNAVMLPNDHPSITSELIDHNNTNVDVDIGVSVAVSDQPQSVEAVGQVSNNETSDVDIKHAHHVGNTSNQPIDNNSTSIMQNLEAYDEHVVIGNNELDNLESSRQQQDNSAEHRQQPPVIASSNAHHGLASIPPNEDGDNTVG
ncbi:putative ankyrin 2,3/unc44 [Schistosoma mansoni]|uniref:putative ankyrin 2,3/unc44 n=1 Tax=Schistosoma mansoni TaxID=6183 RepID=UPI00022DBE94|nr:putative ankyrin 2,3/unc44 [Schistosoma mansoni]|eukprot:XP_018652716.1 putative ankyrin 2,3/unc44 [Schistosoma mansoni]